MKILSLRKDEAKVKVDTPDDLWHSFTKLACNPICATLDRIKK